MDRNFRNHRPLVAAGLMLLGLLTCFFLSGPGTIQADIGRIHARDNSTVSDYEPDFNNGTGTISNATDEARVFKRADGYMHDPADWDTFWKYVCKARQFTNLMLATEAVAAGPPPNGHFVSQSESLKITDLRDSDEWTVSQDIPAYNVRTNLPGLSVLQGLTGVDGVLTHANYHTRVDLDDGRWRRSKYVQDEDYPEAEGGRPTLAYYDTLMNAAGITVILGARSPQFQIAAMDLDQGVPSLNKLSDVLFLAELHNRGVTSVVRQISGGRTMYRNPPRWFVIKDVYGPPDTLAVITRCLRFHGWSEPHLPGWDDKFIFPIGSACYDAILGTQNSAAIAWSLIQHKYKYGEDAVLASVSIWTDQTPNLGSPPNDNPVLGPSAENVATDMPNLLWYTARMAFVQSNFGSIPLSQMRDYNARAEANNPNTIVHQQNFYHPNILAMLDTFRLPWGMHPNTR